MKAFIYIFSIALLMLSCKKDEAPIDMHTDYYGWYEGRYLVYDVMEINHSDGSNPHDTSIYQLKTVIGDTVIDNEGRIARKFWRYKRDNATQDWVLSDLWTSIITNYRAELIEENQRVIKMVFAPTRDKEWDANAFNIKPETESYYDDLHKEFDLNGSLYDSTLIVRHGDQEDLTFISYNDYYEVYANNIGLIKVHLQDLNINNGNILDINYGSELYMNLIEYGFE